MVQSLLFTDGGNWMRMRDYGEWENIDDITVSLILNEYQEAFTKGLGIGEVISNVWSHFCMQQ